MDKAKMIIIGINSSSEDIMNLLDKVLTPRTFILNKLIRVTNLDNSRFRIKARGKTKIRIRISRKCKLNMKMCLISKNSSAFKIIIINRMSPNNKCNSQWI